MFAFVFWPSLVILRYFLIRKWIYPYVWNKLWQGGFRKLVQVKGTEDGRRAMPSFFRLYNILLADFFIDVKGHSCTPRVESSQIWLGRIVHQPLNILFLLFFLCAWVWPPSQETSSKWRFIGIPYKTCNPGGDYCSEEGWPNTALIFSSARLHHRCASHHHSHHNCRGGAGDDGRLEIGSCRASKQLGELRELSDQIC